MCEEKLLLLIFTPDMKGAKEEEEEEEEEEEVFLPLGTREERRVVWVEEEAFLHGN